MPKVCVRSQSAWGPTIPLMEQKCGRNVSVPARVSWYWSAKNLIVLNKMTGDVRVPGLVPNNVWVLRCDLKVSRMVRTMSMSTCRSPAMPRKPRTGTRKYPKRVLLPVRIPERIPKMSVSPYGSPKVSKKCPCPRAGDRKCRKSVRVPVRVTESVEKVSVSPCGSPKVSKKCPCPRAGFRSVKKCL